MSRTVLVVGICAIIVLIGALAPAVWNAVFDALDLALGWMGSFWVVVLVSALTGVLFILAFPHVSLQGSIKSVKDRIKANLLAIRLFQDDLPTVVKSTGGTLGWNFVYLGMNFIPLVVLAGPFMMVWFQLNALYAYQPLQLGQERTIVVELRQDVDPQEVEIVEPQQDEPTPWSLVRRPFRLGDVRDKRIILDVHADAAGSAPLVLSHRGEKVAKEIHVATSPRRLSRVLTASPWSMFFAARDAVVYFGEQGTLPAGSFVRAIELGYGSAPLGPFGGGEITIMIVFVLVSLAVGFGLKGVFGVEI